MVGGVKAELAVKLFGNDLEVLKARADEIAAVLRTVEGPQTCRPRRCSGRPTWGGQFELARKANRRLAVVIPVTLLLICLLLFSSFSSLRNTLLILLNIPLALVGGVVALWAAGENLSVPASVGFIALFGIALENGMVLVACMNQLRDGGMAPFDASVEGASRRVRPVMMTALTTALGLAPLLFASGAGSEVQRPLAVVVVGGLLTSTVLTLLVLPPFYARYCVGNRR